MLSFKIILFVVLCVESILSFPTIQYISKSKVAEIGSDVSLSCNFDDIGENDVSWTKINKDGKIQVISINNVVHINDDRYSVNNLMHEYGNNNAGMYTLMIDNLTVTDNGTYECLIYLTVDKVIFHNSTSLYVFPNDAKNEMVLEGDDAFLDCFDDYYPVDNVIWTKYYKDSLPEGSRIQNGILSIPSTVQDDSGLYICKAEFYIDNELNEANRNVKLEVIPPLDVKVRNPNLVRPQGYNVNMSCLIYSMSPVKVSWSKDNMIIQEDSRHQVQLYETELSSGSFKKRLKVATMGIQALELDDYGAYYCNVENQFGLENKSILLHQNL